MSAEHPAVTETSGSKQREEWVAGPGDTPFYTKEWSPAEGPAKANILFVHGFAEHIARYDTFFTLLSSPPYSFHITAFDQRGHGRTAFHPIQADSGLSEQKVWQEEGRYVKYEKGTSSKRKTGGWRRVIPDIAWFVKREAERTGGKIWLWGFSMGGGEVLKFGTRPPYPPFTDPSSPDPLSLVCGIIAGGPLIRQTHPASWLSLNAGSFASKILPDMLIPTPLNYSHLSHNDANNQANKADPMCEQCGSLRGVADMLNGGIELDSAKSWDKWDKDLPVMIYHGAEDQICDTRASERFVEGVKAERKMFFPVEGMYHEVHNELSPVPERVARAVASFILETTFGDDQSKSKL